MTEMRPAALRFVRIIFVLSVCVFGWSCGEGNPVKVTAATVGPGAAVQETVRLGQRDVSLTLFLFQSKEFEVIVIDNGKDRRNPMFASLRKALDAHRCVAGSNGGFFDVQSFTPQGLMIAGGVETGVFDPNSWMEGVLSSDVSGSSELGQLKGHTPGQVLRHLVQSGPWLVQGDKPEEGFTNDDQPRRRTFIGRDGKGLWVLGTCEKSTLQELAELLVTKQVEQHIDLTEALNLDGGPSTGLAIGDSLYIKEAWTVRNFVGVRRRDKSTGAPEG